MGSPNRPQSVPKQSFSKFGGESPKSPKDMDYLNLRCDDRLNEDEDAEEAEKRQAAALKDLKDLRVEKPRLPSPGFIERDEANDWAMEVPQDELQWHAEVAEKLEEERIKEPEPVMDTAARIRAAQLDKEDAARRAQRDAKHEAASGR